MDNMWKGYTISGKAININIWIICGKTMKYLESLERRIVEMSSSSKVWQRGIFHKRPELIFLLCQITGNLGQTFILASTQIL